MGLTDDVRAYAEAPDRHAAIVEGSSVSRYDDGRVCVLQGPTWASITSVDVGEDEVGALVAQVRGLVPPTKHCTWWIAPSARPADLVERLHEHGLRAPSDRVGLVKSLALVTPPPEAAPGIEVRRIENYEDFLAARDVQWEAFEIPEERREQQRAHLRADFDDTVEFGTPVDFLATLEGRPAATGMAIPSTRGVFLVAGSTAPWARGRGLYRALVRARWEYAVARGTPVVITQAVPDTSYPILKRLGFQDVCDVVRLEDRR